MLRQALENFLGRGEEYGEVLDGLPDWDQSRIEACLGELVAEDAALAKEYQAQRS